MARIGLNKKEVVETQPKSKFWQCSLCHTEIPDGALICTGCHGIVRYKQYRRRARVWIFGILGIIIGALFVQITGALIGGLIGIILGAKIPLSSKPITRIYQNYRRY
jgi:predicted nucleic acid-binding Zn ribbon protein